MTAVRVIDSLADLVGAWTGTNRFWLMPTDATEPLESAARLDVVAGNGITFSYTWVHPADGPQLGFLFMYDAADGSGAAGGWLDTWHQTPAPMDLRGAADTTGVRLAGSYGTESGWSIVVSAGDDAGLRLGMDNLIGPDSEPYPVMAAFYTRAG